MNSEDEILREFAECYPYCFSDLKEMLVKDKQRRTAESLVKQLKEKLLREKDNNF